MTYNVQLLNFGAANAETRKPMIIQIIRSEAPDIVGLQELSSTHRSDIEAGLQDLYDFYDGRSPETPSRFCCERTSLRPVETAWSHS